MSFTSELKKVGSLEEAQLLFEKEVARLGTLDVYQMSERRYINRIEKVQRDIYKHLDTIGVQGTLFLYQDMLQPQFEDNSVSIKDQISELERDELERDKRFFRRLFLGIFVWIIGLIVLAYYSQNLDVKHMKPVKSAIVMVDKIRCYNS